MKYFLSTVLAIAAFAFSASAESVSSGVFGTYQFECPANCDTFISIPVTRAPEFSGTVESVLNDAVKIVAKGEPNWAVNKFVYSKGVQGNFYYVKFTSGTLEGAWFNVVSNTAYALELEIGAAELAKVVAGDTFEIIPHWTLATLFPDGGGFTKATSIVQTKGATLLWKYTIFRDGKLVYPIGKNSVYSTMYFYREYGTNIGWKNGSGVDASDDVIEPNCFIDVLQPQTASASITVSGTMPMVATSIIAFNAKDENGKIPDQDIYLAVPSGVNIKLSDLTSTFIDSGLFTPSTGIAVAPVDMLMIYDNSKKEKNPSPTSICFYRKRPTIAKWINANGDNMDDFELKAGTALVIRKKTNNLETATRATYKPFYIQ